MMRSALLAAALLLSAAPLFAAGAGASSRPAGAAPALPRAALPPVPAGSATIGEITGSPDVLLDGIEPWVKASAGMQLTPGSQIRTGAGSATLVFFDGSKVRVSQHAEFTLETAERSNIQVYLSLGKLEAWVAHLRSRSFKARTPTSVAAVRGTVFALTTTGKKTEIELFRGSLAVNDNFGRSALLSAGQGIQTGVTPGHTPLKPAPLPKGTVAPREPRIVLATPSKAPAEQTAQSGKHGPQAGQQPPPPTDTLQSPAGSDGADQQLSGTQPPPPNPTQNNAVAPISPSAP